MNVCITGQDQSDKVPHLAHRMNLESGSVVWTEIGLKKML